MITIKEVWNNGNHIDDWVCEHNGTYAKEWLIEYNGDEYTIVTDFDDTVLDNPNDSAPLFIRDDDDQDKTTI
jgi:hypothetical protein